LKVTYARTDGTAVTIPFVTIWRMRGDRVKDYRIHTDIEPLYSTRS
jgi:hypothetical protein